MAWTVYGDPLASGDLTSTDISQPVIMNQNLLMRAVRMWIILVGDPTFTDLSCKIYGNDADAANPTPTKLLHTSTDVRTKAEILTTESHGVKEIYFTFNDVPLNGGDTYHVVLNGTGYSPTANSFIAFRRAWPDPVYTENYTVTTGALTRSPFFVSSIVGASF